MAVLTEANTIHGIKPTNAEAKNQTPPDSDKVEASNALFVLPSNSRTGASVLTVLGVTALLTGFRPSESPTEPGCAGPIEMPPLSDTEEPESRIEQTFDNELFWSEFNKQEEFFSQIKDFVPLSIDGNREAISFDFKDVSSAETHKYIFAIGETKESSKVLSLFQANEAGEIKDVYLLSSPEETEEGIVISQLEWEHTENKWDKKEPVLLIEETDAGTTLSLYRDGRWVIALTEGENRQQINKVLASLSPRLQETPEPTTLPDSTTPPELTVTPEGTIGVTQTTPSTETATIEPSPTPTEKPTEEPTEQPMEELQPAGKEVTINGEKGEFILVDSEAGEFLPNFGLEASNLGWSQTREGKWVIFDRASKIAIETRQKSEIDRLELSPGMTKNEGNVSDLVTQGFYIGYSERRLALNPENPALGEADFGIFRFFIPVSGGNGIIVESGVMGAKSGGKLCLCFQFNEVGSEGENVGIRSVSEVLSHLSLGDSVRCTTAFASELLSMIEEEGLEAQSEYQRTHRVFRRGHSGLQERVLDDYNHGRIQDSIFIGILSVINYFPSP